MGSAWAEGSEYQGSKGFLCYTSQDPGSQADPGSRCSLINNHLGQRFLNPSVFVVAKLSSREQNLLPELLPSDDRLVICFHPAVFEQ